MNQLVWPFGIPLATGLVFAFANANSSDLGASTVRFAWIIFECMCQTDLVDKFFDSFAKYPLKHSDNEMQTGGIFEMEYVVW